MSKSRIIYLAKMSFNAIRENKILAKISEFTVYLIPPPPPEEGFVALLKL